ncbi:unnamed protein product [Diabrotica balteata]|uniref:Uncharacterized protein n=1 Tax=Diabrotica balteata TaxID=107213 RepID=A0A9N9TDT5_DIABA|nr:unnamed protein product [Diabrotica balteata]
MVLTKNLINITGMFLTRTFSSQRKFDRIKRLQRKFQVDDGRPVWMKSKMDKFLYRFTVASLLLGLTWGLYTVLWEISYVKRFRS